MGRHRRQHLALQLTQIPQAIPSIPAVPDTDANSDRDNVRPAASRKRGRELTEEPESRLNPKNPSVTITLDHLASFGKHFTRTVDLFAPWASILRDGLSFEVDRAEEAEEEYTDEECSNHRKFTILVSSFNIIEGRRFLDDLLDPSTGRLFTDAVVAVLDSQLSEAKTNDTATLKRRVIQWIGNPENIDPEVKTGRGFKHDCTARYLLPLSQYPFTSDKRRAIDNGEVKLCAADWPMFIYAKNERRSEPREQRIGMFKGEILLMATKAVLTSPSSVSGSNQSRRTSNASKHGMDSITPESIAYMCVLLYYALCEDSTFAIPTRAGFDLKAFYYGIIAYFHNPNNKRHVDSTLKWWNKQVFPHAHRGTEEGGNGVPEFADDDGVDYSDEEP